MPRKKKPQIDGRKRVWCFEVYPDSAPKNWMAMLQDAHVKAFVSPLHDSDKHESGEPKKPHYHVELMYNGKQNLETVRETVAAYAANGFVEPVNSLEGYARYLCHLDDPQKAQYQVSDVRELGGADYLATIGQAGDVRRYIGQMQEWCRENACTSFAELMDYAYAERPEWHDALCKRCSMVMYRYVISMANELKEGSRVPKKTPEEVAEVARRVKAESEEAKARAKALEQEENRRLGVNHTPVSADIEKEAVQVPVTQSADYDPLAYQLGGTLTENFG